MEKMTVSAVRTGGEEGERVAGGGDLCGERDAFKGDGLGLRAHCRYEHACRWVTMGIYIARAGGELN